MKSEAPTVVQYLESLPEERRAMIAAVREVVLAHLPEGYEETMRWGMISYEVPLARYPKTYNKQPLNFAALASQKNNCAIYLSAVYGDPAREKRLCDGAAAEGKKLDRGKSCIRFRKVENLPLETIGELIADLPVDAFLARYEAARTQGRH